MLSMYLFHSIEATLYVDKILASSMTDGKCSSYLYPYVNSLLNAPQSHVCIFCLLVSEYSGSNYLNFGLFKIHIHTFLSRVGAPLLRSICTKIDSKHCETQVDDGEGGAMNIMIKSADDLLKQDQGLGLLVLSAAGAISLFGYYAFMGLVPIAFVMSVAMLLVKKQPIGQAKNKMA